MVSINPEHHRQHSLTTLASASCFPSVVQGLSVTCVCYRGAPHLRKLVHCLSTWKLQISVPLWGLNPWPMRVSRSQGLVGKWKRPPGSLSDTCFGRTLQCKSNSELWVLVVKLKSMLTQTQNSQRVSFSPSEVHSYTLCQLPCAH